MPQTIFKKNYINQLFKCLLMASDFDRFDDDVEQSLNDRFCVAFRCLIFCLVFVQIYRPRIRLMSNKKIGTFTKTASFCRP